MIGSRAEAPVTVAAVAASAPALAARAKKKSAFLRGVAVLVSEQDPGTNDDAQSIRHSPESTEGCTHEIASDPPVRGYLHWSLLDDLEGAAGYVPRFSLVAVDHTTFARTNEAGLNAPESVVGKIPPDHRWA